MGARMGARAENNREKGLLRLFAPAFAPLSRQVIVWKIALEARENS